MTLKSFILPLFLIPALFDQAPNFAQMREHKNEAFQKGEVLKFRLHYGIIDAGTATLEVKNEEKKFGDRSAYHIVGTGETKGAFDWFFKVRDRYETYIDEKAIAPWVFIRRVDEGGYKINQNYVFNHYKKSVNADGKNFEIPQYAQDMLSSFYYARCLDFSNAKPGQIFSMESFMDNEVYPVKIRYIGREIITTSLGTFRCIKFRPVVQTGRVFKKEEDLNVWITDDKNHIPVRAQAEILVGSIKMDLLEYKNLANPLSKIN
jgi:hypothetical protein